MQAFLVKLHDSDRVSLAFCVVFLPSQQPSLRPSLHREVYLDSPNYACIAAKFVQLARVKQQLLVSGEQESFS